MNNLSKFIATPLLLAALTACGGGGSSSGGGQAAGPLSVNGNPPGMASLATQCVQVLQIAVNETLIQNGCAYRIRISIFRASGIGVLSLDPGEQSFVLPFQEGEAVACEEPFTPFEAASGPTCQA